MIRNESILDIHQKFNQLDSRLLNLSQEGDDSNNFLVINLGSGLMDNLDLIETQIRDHALGKSFDSLSFLKHRLSIQIKEAMENIPDLTDFSETEQSLLGGIATQLNRLQLSIQNSTNILYTSKVAEALTIIASKLTEFIDLKFA